MSKLQHLAFLAFLAVPFTAAMIGCGPGTETTVIEEDPNPEMTDEEYENESMGGTDDMNDEAQN